MISCDLLKSILQSNIYALVGVVGNSKAVIFCKFARVECRTHRANSLSVGYLSSCQARSSKLSS